jgi:hypothetical protein
VEPVIVVEILEKSGKVRERFRRDRFPIHIGRSYQNEIILDDEYVSPTHLSIELSESGQLYIADLNSTNGVYQMPASKPIMRKVIGDEIIIRVGHTLLRIRTPAFDVPSAKELEYGFAALTQSFNRSSTFFGILILTGLWIMVETFWNSFSKPQLGDLVLLPLWFIAGISIWAGIWALLSKIFMHHHYFKAHVFIVCVGLLAFSVFDTAHEYYSFGFSAGFSTDILFWIGVSLVLGFILWGHLRLCTHKSSKKIALGTGMVVFTMVGLFGFSWNIVSNQLIGSLNFHGELKPPPFQLVKSANLDQFFQEVQTMKTRVDQPIKKGWDQVP